MPKPSLIAALLLAGCTFAPNNDPWSGVMDGLDSRTQKVREMCAGYCSNDASAWTKHFAEDAVLHVNDSDLTLSEVSAAFSAGHEVFADIRHENVTCTTMRYNHGQIYTNYWYVWKGTARSTGEELSIKGYAWFRWEGDQVVESYNAFDPTRYNELAAGSAAEIK